MRPGESFIAQPVRSLQTMLRVIAEADTRQPGIIPDGIYGPSTMLAVTAFQRRNGIPVTGIVDQNTWEQIVSAYESAIIRIGKAEPIEILLEPGEILRRGSSSPYIYLLQSMLIQLSKDSPTIPEPEHTGILDASTEAAILAFQILAGLEQTGELDRITWKNISKQFTLNAHRSRGRQIR